MPATLIVTFERRSQMASRIERLVETLPVRIVRTRSAPDFAAAIAGGPFPIAILEAEADPDLLPELVVEGRRYRGWVVIVGETGGWSRQMHLREAGAHCL